MCKTGIYFVVDCIPVISDYIKVARAMVNKILKPSFAWMNKNRVVPRRLGVNYADL